MVIAGRTAASSQVTTVPNSRGDSPSVRLLQDKKKRSGEVQDALFTIMTTKNFNANKMLMSAVAAVVFSFVFTTSANADPLENTQKTKLVIEHAYPFGTEGSVEVTMMSDGHQLKVVIDDSGMPFDPTIEKKVDITLSAEERQVGGLGILLVRELMDTINYEHINGHNILTLSKKISLS